MPTIHLTTFIAAPAAVVFDLARHIGLHKESMSRFKEEAVAGTRFGLIEKEETVTWKARHLYKERLIRMKVTEMIKPEMYTGEQVQGGFKSLKHEHYFKPCENGTLLIDIFHYEMRYGLLGKVFGKFYISQYVKKILELRNKKIKEYAESGRWKPFLNK
jgi:ligand-binding SRPBCC domain-containing protein